jgi:RecF/RecN/SMC N terminal domain
MAGIRFTAMPPMKRFRDMDQLSGGEKTMAALALLFSIHSYRQAPFFVLDEVDAALDNVNVKKICNYIRQRSHDFQCVVISLKDMFFEHADILVGICKDVETLSSKVLTLNLRDYDAPNQHQANSALAAGRPVLRSPLTDPRSSSTPSTRMSASTAGSGRLSSHGTRGNRNSGGGGGEGGANRDLGLRGVAKQKRKADGAGNFEGSSRRIRPSLPESIAEEGEDDLQEDEDDNADGEDYNEHK